MKGLEYFLAILLIAQPVFADTSVKSDVVLAGESQSRVSGLKKRVESQIPIVGKVVIITRVDLGVEWILKPDKKMYQEKPIALSYTAPGKSGSDGGEDSGGWGASSGDSETAESSCVPEIRKFPQTRLFAGYKTTGFTAACGKETLPGKIWMTPPLGLLAEVEKEDKAYNRAHATALFSNYPPEEARELIDAMENLGDLAKGFLVEKMAKGTRFPSGVIMAVEGSLDSGPSKMIFEVKEIHRGPVDPALFEIPAGYQKVPDLAKALLQSSLQSLDKFADAAQAVKSFFSQPGTAGTPGGQLADIVARLKKAMNGTASPQQSGQAADPDAAS